MVVYDGLRQVVDIKVGHLIHLYSILSAKQHAALDEDHLLESDGTTQQSGGVINE